MLKERENKPEPGEEAVTSEAAGETARNGKPVQAKEPNHVYAIYVLSFLFSGGSSIPAPYPDAGIDPTPDLLECSP